MLFPLHTCMLTPLHSLKIYFKNHHCKSARVLHHTYLVAQMVKNSPAMQETRVWFLGQEDPLEEETATHSIVLAWEIPWTEEPGGLQSMGSQRDTTEQLTFSLHFTSLLPGPFITVALWWVLSLSFTDGETEREIKYHAQGHRGSKL